jgi:hypothetical protein
VFLKSGSLIRRLASLPWLRAGPVRQLRRYYQGAMTACRPSRRASLPSLGGTSVALVLFAPERTSAPLRPGVGHPVAPSGMYRGNDRLSQVLGEPRLSVCTCSTPTPAGPQAPDRVQCRGVALGHRTAKAPAKGLSTLNSMAFGLAVYASQCKLPRPTQDSLPAAGQALPGRLSTRKVPLKGF